MKIEITTVRNGLLVEIKELNPTASDPLAQRVGAGVWFARDTMDALGRIAEAVKKEYDPIVDQLERD